MTVQSNKMDCNPDWLTQQSITVSIAGFDFIEIRIDILELQGNLAWSTKSLSLLLDYP